MLFWFIKSTLISIVIIMVVHHLINFFKNTLTVPKIKDLVNSPTQKYENIFNTLNHKTEKNIDVSISTSTDIDQLLPKQTNDSMKNELKNFLKAQMNNDNNVTIPMSMSMSNNQGTTDISLLDSMMPNQNAYTPYN